MALRQKLLDMRILVETDESNMTSTLNFVKSSLKSSCRNLKNGSVVLGLYDEEGQLVGLDITGNPSGELTDMIENLFGDEEEPTTQESRY